MRILAWLLIVLFQGYVGVTKFNRPCIIFNSRDPDKPNICYKFIKIERKNQDNCFKCSHCASIKRTTKNGFRIEQIKVNHGDIFETDPEEPGRHCCTGEVIARLRGCELLQDVADENRNTGALKHKIEENHPDVADNEWISQYCKKQAKSSSEFIIEALEAVDAEEAHDHPQQQQNLNTSLPVYFNHSQQFNYYPRPPGY